MAKLNGRRLPVGIQSFQKIRKEGYLYVDKTDIIWDMVFTSVVRVDSASLCLSIRYRCIWKEEKNYLMD